MIENPKCEQSKYLTNNCHYDVSQDKIKIEVNYYLKFRNRYTVINIGD